MGRSWSFCCLRAEGAAYPREAYGESDRGCDVNTAVAQRTGILLQARRVACLGDARHGSSCPEHTIGGIARYGVDDGEYFSQPPRSGAGRPRLALRTILLMIVDPCTGDVMQANMSMPDPQPIGSSPIEFHQSIRDVLLERACPVLARGHSHWLDKRRRCWRRSAARAYLAAQTGMRWRQEAVKGPHQHAALGLAGLHCQAWPNRPSPRTAAAQWDG